MTERQAQTPTADITGAVLAGGRGSRLGGADKGLVTVGGRPMVAHILAALTPQVGTMLINANRNRPDYERYGWPVVADTLGDYSGPLAGMASVLEAARTPWVVTVPCDSPLVPPDLVARLDAARIREHAELSVAYGADRLQPVFALLPRRLLPSLNEYLAAGERKIDRWYARHRMAQADLSDCPDAFLNVNTPEDRAAMEARLADSAP